MVAGGRAGRRGPCTTRNAMKRAFLSVRSPAGTGAAGYSNYVSRDEPSLFGSGGPIVRTKES
jgi:hypothetical protein